MAKNWEHAAGILWPLLTEAAQKKETLTYGELAPSVHTNPLSVGRALGPIQDYCLESRLPPLTAIVIGSTTGVPGGGFIAWDVDDLKTAHAAVFTFNWTSTANPYGGFGQTDTTESLARHLIQNPEAAADLYAKVKVRGTAQAIFRAALLQTYDGSCAVCGFSFEEALDAAHLKPWPKCNHAERLDPTNGLLLCASHHRLFDAGMITLSESFKVIYADPQMKNGSYSEADKSLSIDLHNRAAYLPSDSKHRPSLQFLRAHHQEKKWGNVP
jgi:putative restriction endonuclease